MGFRNEVVHGLKDLRKQTTNKNKSLEFLNRNPNLDPCEQRGHHRTSSLLRIVDRFLYPENRPLTHLKILKLFENSQNTHIDQSLELKKVFIPRDNLKLLELYKSLQLTLSLNLTIMDLGSIRILSHLLGHTCIRYEKRLRKVG